MKILAALYVAACLTWLGCYLIRNADRYFWKGVGIGALIVVGYGVFLCSAMYLLKGSIW